MPKETDSVRLRKEFLKTATHIKAMGFRVFIYKDDQTTYGYYSDGTHVGYFQQCGSTDGVSIATRNKVPGSYGMGLLLEPHCKPLPLKDITKEYLQKGFLSHPEYFSEDDRLMMPNIKYGNLDEFLSSIDTDNIEEI